MENLWSPWRNSYIDNFKDNSEKKECFLCAGINSLQKNTKKELQDHLIVKQSGSSFVILNKYPYNSGHILICPKSHVAELDTLSSEEYLDLMNLLKQAYKISKKIYTPHGFNIGLNAGSAAGAGVPGHLHWHIIPRWSGDTNFMASIADIKVISQEINKTFELYYNAFEESGDKK